MKSLALIISLLPNDGRINNQSKKYIEKTHKQKNQMKQICVIRNERVKIFISFQFANITECNNLSNALRTKQGKIA